MATVYMSLDLPVVSVTLGPLWATMLNAAFTVVDDHDHTAGKGRPITAAAINVNSDLSFGSNNLDDTGSIRLITQPSLLVGASDLRALYAFGGELYFRDSSGNNVKITNLGSLNATAIGGIGGDYTSSTASVTYSSISKTFTFNQNTNQRAKLDIGDLTIRETVVGANGITIKSPTGLAAGYTITLPSSLPAANRLVQIDSSGNFSNVLITDALIDAAGISQVSLATNSIGTPQLIDDSVTSAKLDPAANLVKITKLAAGSNFALVTLSSIS